MPPTPFCTHPAPKNCTRVSPFSICEIRMMLVTVLLISSVQEWSNSWGPRWLIWQWLTWASHPSGTKIQHFEIDYNVISPSSGTKSRILDIRNCIQCDITSITHQIRMSFKCARFLWLQHNDCFFLFRQTAVDFTMPYMNTGFVLERLCFQIMTLMMLMMTTIVMMIVTMLMIPQEWASSSRRTSLLQTIFFPSSRWPLVVFATNLWIHHKLTHSLSAALVGRVDLHDHRLPGRLDHYVPARKVPRCPPIFLTIRTSSFLQTI